MTDDILLKLITTYNVNIVLQQATKEEWPLKKLFGEPGVREVKFEFIIIWLRWSDMLPSQYDEGSVNVRELSAFFQGGAGSHEESPCFPW